MTRASSYWVKRRRKRKSIRWRKVHRRPGSLTYMEHCVFFILILYKTSGNERKHTHSTNLIFLGIKYPHLIRQLLIL